MSIPIERINFFGDITGVKSGQMASFLRATEHHLYGGSYPAREPNRGDQEVIEHISDLLIRAGLSNPSPITPCSSAEERIGLILEGCHRTPHTQDGLPKIYIIDNNPHALVTAARSFLNNNSTSQALLRTMTIIQLGGTHQLLDYVDYTTGVRKVVLPYYASPFPTHPAPAA